MKNLLKVVVLSFFISVFLSMHVNASGEAEIIITVADASGTYEGNVSVIFSFKSGPEKIVISREDRDLAIPKTLFSLSYGEIAVSAKLDDDNWEVVDGITGKPLESVNLEKDTVCYMTLLIQEKQISIETKEEHDNLFNFDAVQATEKEVRTYEVEEGYQLFKNYLDASYFLSDGSYDEWMMYSAFSLIDAVHRVTNLSDDEWNSLSEYEKFVYTTTYIQLADFKATGLASSFIKEWDEGIPEDYKSMYLKCPKADEETQERYMNAVEEFMTWQMGYFRQNGYPYDFVRDMSYAEEVLGDVGSNKPQEESVTNNEIEEAMEVFENELSDEEKKQIVDVAKENMEKESATEVEKKSEEKGKHWLLLLSS